MVSSRNAEHSLDKRVWFTLSISYAGIALGFVHDLNINPEKVLDGGVLVPLSAVLYAGYHVGAGQVIKRVGAVRFAALASIVSTLPISLHFMVTREAAFLMQQFQYVWMLTGWMALVSSVLPILTMAEGLRCVDTSNAAMPSSIGPIATIFMDYQNA